MRLRRPSRAQPIVNLTPLMDILFIVLLFLVLTTTFQEVTTFPVQLPGARSAERENVDARRLVSISIAEDGTLDVDGDEVTMQELTGRLASLPDAGRVTVRVRADARVAHGTVVTVMDAARRYGVRHLSIETRRATARTTPPAR